MNDSKIVLHPVDNLGPDADYCYCAIVLLWSRKDKIWYNSGIVTRDLDPIQAVQIAISKAKEQGIWE